MSVAILGIDPGETTGWAYLIADRERELLGVAGYGQWSGMYELAKVLESKLFDVKIIAMEKYIIYPHASMSHIGSSVYTAQEIGRILWIAHQREIAVYEQMASMAKQRWPNERIRDYLPEVPLTKEFKHCVDALRHALTCWERNFR